MHKVPKRYCDCNLGWAMERFRNAANIDSYRDIIILDSVCPVCDLAFWMLHGRGIFAKWKKALQLQQDARQRESEEA